MRFDDRLQTVLDAPVADDRDRAVRWRQLVDLLSRARGDGDDTLFGRAIDAAAAERDHVPDAVRAATARSIAGRPLDGRLVALFAADRLDVAAPVLAGSNLDEASREAVVAAASDEVRRFFFALEGRPAERDKPVEISADAEPVPSIGDVVARIERLRLSREGGAGEEAIEAEQPIETAPVPHAPVEPLFRWESDASGAIRWVDGAPRAAMIGRQIAGQPGEALLDEKCRALVMRRAPFADMPAVLEGPFDGDWRVSGAPAFAPADGRFMGYRGLARRIDAAPTAPRASAAASAIGHNVESLREMIHEVKTPLNAIIGFAEIIDGQYLGPAHRNYRHRAADILDQARRLLDALDDLDFAAKLRRDRVVSGEGTDFRDIFPKMADELNDYGADRGIGIVFQLNGTFTRCGLAPELAERMTRRYVTSVIDSCGDGEALTVGVGPSKGMCGVTIERPVSLRGVPDEEIFDPAYVGPRGEGRVGLGFAMRLVRALVRIAGGDLVTDADRFTLRIPTAH